ncbi:MAG TPA: FHA domain-containing protein [Oligoflexia bacterium]|nr:FHA domain-containing protein [Oligoflexia bacterium]HMR23959.1 FHA domain-containing protein [Oligoflexia bacterium]
MSQSLAIEIQLEGKVIESILLEPNITYVGRLAENHIVLDDPEVSRSHMCIIFDELRGYRIEDQASENGTYLNGQKVNKAPVALGDRIELGRYILRLVENSQAKRAVRKDDDNEDTMNLNTTMNINEADISAVTGSYNPKVQMFFEMGSRMIEKEVSFDEEVNGMPNYVEVEMVFGSKRIRKRISI